MNCQPDHPLKEILNSKGIKKKYLRKNPLKDTAENCMEKSWRRSSTSMPVRVVPEYSITR